MSAVDPKALPLRGVVRDVQPEGERWRVTFTRLVGIYYADDAALADQLRAAAEATEELDLTYDRVTKHLSLRPSR